jgi:hypothetical protein
MQWQRRIIILLNRGVMLSGQELKTGRTETPRRAVHRSVGLSCSAELRSTCLARASASPQGQCLGRASASAGPVPRQHVSIPEGRVGVRRPEGIPIPKPIEEDGHDDHVEER